MTTSRTQRIVLTGAAATAQAPPATAPAAPAPAASKEPGATAEAPDHEGNDENPTYTSSVTAPDTENESGLDGRATVSPDDAIAAAQTATGGTATHAELENELLSAMGGHRRELEWLAGSGEDLSGVVA